MRERDARTQVSCFYLGRRFFVARGTPAHTETAVNLGREVRNGRLIGKGLTLAGIRKANAFATRSAMFRQRLEAADLIKLLFDLQAVLPI
jgi:hypothetical protein